MSYKERKKIDKQSEPNALAHIIEQPVDIEENSWKWNSLVNLIITYSENFPLFMYRKSDLPQKCV